MRVYIRIFELGVRNWSCQMQFTDGMCYVIDRPQEHHRNKVFCADRTSTPCPSVQRYKVSRQRSEQSSAHGGYPSIPLSTEDFIVRLSPSESPLGPGRSVSDGSKFSDHPQFLPSVSIVIDTILGPTIHTLIRSTQRVNSTE